MLGSLGVEHRLLDANLEGLIHLLRMPAPPEADDAWTRRAFRNRAKNISSLRDPGLYRHPDRYKRAVGDLGRVLARVFPSGAVGLANYEHKGLSPLRSGDLLTSAERPETDPFYPYFRTRLLQLIRPKKPSAVGISLNYLSQALSAFSMIGFMKREFPEIKVILGGGLITSWTRNSGWKNPFSGLVDHIVAGQGEQELLSILGLEAVAGTIPRPDYSRLPRGSYLSPGFILPYSASAGCYWHRCDFCPEKAEGNPYLQTPPLQVCADLKALAEETGPALIHLLDNAISPALLDALCADSPGVPWYGFARVGPGLSDPDYCEALKRAGCRMLKLGIESGDQGVLNALQKGISIDTASIVLRNLKKAGIASYVYLIFGTPPETEASAGKTLEFTVRHSDSIDFLNLAIFNMPRNMPVCGKADAGIERRSFSEADLSLYTDFVHPSGWDRKRVRLFLDNKFKRHPAVSAILKNDPPVFTSNHAPFFLCNEVGV